MNADHAATVHAMVQSSCPSKGKVSNARMKRVRLDVCELSYVLCDGALCEMRTGEVKFAPPLSSAKDARPRLIEEHHKALSPRIGWLFADFFTIFILAICLLLGFATHVVGTKEVVESISNRPLVDSMISSVFGSARTFGRWVEGGWYFAIVAHVAEGIYAAYLCKTKLKTKVWTAFQWFLLTCSVGWPITSRVVELVEVDRKAREGKGE